jgi:hypothetical protein
MMATRRLAAIFAPTLSAICGSWATMSGGRRGAVRKHREAAHRTTLNANYDFPPTATSTVMIFNDRVTSIVWKNSIFRVDHNLNGHRRP